jgi:hypothetical protein
MVCTPSLAVQCGVTVDQPLCGNPPPSQPMNRSKSCHLHVFSVPFVNHQSVFRTVIALQAVLTLA